MSDSLPPARGLVAGKYEVLHLIGRGGMGSVWEGRHTSLGTRVAIKFVDSEHAQSDEARSRFVTEARAAAAIHSKHAIQIYDHGLADDGRPYIVMELLVGEPLDERIHRAGHLSLQETARILGQVCRALVRAHEAGIIHRDLKPENIFLVRSSEDDDEIAKVLDFGIAKIRTPLGEQPASSSTQTGAVLGTPHYMSPEQARGLRTIDHRTDLWSLGVIAYKCVTGVLPFEGVSVGDLLVKICTGPVPTPSLLAPELPPSFDAWFARALDRDPEKRFADATELAEALALAAGVSSRRASSGGQALPDRPSGDRAPRVLAERAAAAPASNTAAPFTAPASPTKPSRAMVFGVVAAALVGGSIGVAMMARIASSPSPKKAEPPRIEVAALAIAAPTEARDAMALPKASPSAPASSTALASQSPPARAKPSSPIATPPLATVASALPSPRVPPLPAHPMAKSPPPDFKSPPPPAPSHAAAPQSADPGY